MFVLFLLFLSLIFRASEASETLANVSTKNKNSLPELHEGEQCTPGKSYKMSCNTCRCGQNNNLLCTKMACLDNKSVAKLLKMKLNHAPGKEKILRSIKSDDYPEYMPKVDCIPGKVYKRGCNRCFCNEFHIALCSLKGCSKNDTRFHRNVVPEDVRPAFTASELDSLVVLPHTAAPCIAGRSYRVDCNTCLCKADGNLLCDKMICLIYDKYNSKEAAKLSGLPCSKDGSSTKCINCKCVNGKTKCEAEEGCVSDVIPTNSNSRQKLLFHKKTKLGLAIDPHEDKCIPGQIYKQSCNKCYCQKNGSLRCTQKKCLNFGEAVKLQRHKLFLAEHGD